VPFTLAHAGKYLTEDKLKNRHTTKTKHNPEKANKAKHSKTKLAWFSRLIRHSARKQGPKPTRTINHAILHCLQICTFFLEHKTFAPFRARFTNVDQA